MRVVLILILAALSGWLAYDRSKLQEQMSLATDKMSAAQAALEVSKKETASALAMLSQKAPELAKAKNWLQERIENRNDMLSQNPAVTSPNIRAVRTWGTSVTPYPNTNTYPYGR